MLRHSLHFSRLSLQGSRMQSPGMQSPGSLPSTFTSLQPQFQSPVPPQWTIWEMPHALSAFPMLISARLCELASHISSAKAKISVCKQVHSVLSPPHPLSLGLLAMICYHFDLLEICLPDQKILVSVCSAHHGVGPWRVSSGMISMIFLKGHFLPLFACLQLLSSIFHWLLFIIDKYI